MFCLRMICQLGQAPAGLLEGSEDGRHVYDNLQVIAFT